MRRVLHLALALWTLLGAAPGMLASAASEPAAVPPPRDTPYPGQIRIEADARDVQRRIVHVQETVTGLGPHPVLLYPKWLPGTHAPEGPVDRLAAIEFTANGAPIAWTRDPLNVFALRPQLPAGASSVEVRFDYLSPTSDRVGDLQMSDASLILEPNDLVLYPAGFYARRIPVEVSVRFPAGWQRATSLESTGEEGDRSVYRSVSLETFIDSPIYAGRYVKTLELDAATHVRLELFADRADLLEASPEVISAHRALITQAYRLFRSRHYLHYDFLLTLSDAIPFNGLEHHQSSANSTGSDYLLDWADTAADRDLLAHEFTHSWNGKFRRPADLWTPSYEVPMQNSLLWVYEGQTQYWGMVLTTRAGLWTPAQALEQWAELAAYSSTEPGRSWRALADTTNDEILNPRRPQSWRDWQRFEDYYDESALIWLDADTLIRERSGGKRSLDDFAARFFSVNDGSMIPLTYTFDDIVKALNAVEPYDWAVFLRKRVSAVAPAAPLEGLARAGYRLIWNEQPNEQEKSREHEHKETLLLYSAGLAIDEKEDSSGTLLGVGWDSPAFKAGLTEGMRIIAVNGDAYSADTLKQAINFAARDPAPIELIVRNGDRYAVKRLDYHAGLRYPHLTRDSSAVPAHSLLDAILEPRT